MLPVNSSKKNGRRSSILKPPKVRTRTPFQEVDFNNPSSSESSPNTAKLKRRVSFAEKKHVKEFCDLEEQGTLWDNTYEESEASNTKSVQNTNDMPMGRAHGVKANSNVSESNDKTNIGNQEVDSILQFCNYTSTAEAGERENFDSNNIDASRTNIFFNEDIEFTECIGHKQTMPNELASPTSVHVDSDLDLTEMIGGLEMTEIIQTNKRPNFNESEVSSNANVNQENVGMRKRFKTGEDEVFYNESELNLESLSKSSPNACQSFDRISCMAPNRTEIFEDSSMEFTIVAPHRMSSSGGVLNLSEKNCTVQDKTKVFRDMSMEFTAVVKTTTNSNKENIPIIYQNTEQSFDKTILFDDDTPETTEGIDTLRNKLSNEHNMFGINDNTESQSAYQLLTVNSEKDRGNVCKIRENTTINRTQFFNDSNIDFTTVISGSVPDKEPNKTTLYVNCETDISRSVVIMTNPEQKFTTSNSNITGHEQHMSEREITGIYLRRINDDDRMITERHTTESNDLCANAANKTSMQDCLSKTIISVTPLDLTEPINTKQHMSKRGSNTIVEQGCRIEEINTENVVRTGQTVSDKIFLTEPAMNESLSKTVSVTGLDLTLPMSIEQNMLRGENNKTYMRQFYEMSSERNPIESSELYANRTNEIATNDTLSKPEEFNKTYIKQSDAMNADRNFIESNELCANRANEITTNNTFSETKILNKTFIKQSGEMNTERNPILSNELNANGTNEIGTNDKLSKTKEVNKTFIKHSGEMNTDRNLIESNELYAKGSNEVATNDTLSKTNEVNKTFTKQYGEMNTERNSMVSNELDANRTNEIGTNDTLSKTKEVNKTYIKQYGEMSTERNPIESNQLYVNGKNEILTNHTLPTTLSASALELSKENMIHQNSAMAPVEQAHIDAKMNSGSPRIKCNKLFWNEINDADVNDSTSKWTTTPAKEVVTNIDLTRANELRVTDDQDEREPSDELIVPGSQYSNANESLAIHENNSCHDFGRLALGHTPTSHNVDISEDSILNLSSELYTEIREIEESSDNTGHFINRYESDVQPQDCYSECKGTSETIPSMNRDQRSTKPQDYYSKCKDNSETIPATNRDESNIQPQHVYSECKDSSQTIQKDQDFCYSVCKNTSDMVQKDEDYSTEWKGGNEKVEKDLFSILTENIEVHAQCDQCIWKIRCLDRRKLAVDFISKSLLVIVFLESNEEGSTVDAIKKIQIISLLTDEAEELIKLVHCMIMNKLKPEILIQSYNTIGDILPLLEIVSHEVMLAVDFMHELIRLQDLNLMDIGSKRVSFIIHTAKVQVILKVTIDLRPLDEICSNDVSVDCLVGSIREDDIKQLITSVKKDHRFLLNYMNYIKEYIAVVIEK